MEGTMDEEICQAGSATCNAQEGGRPNSGDNNVQCRGWHSTSQTLSMYCEQ